MIRLRSVFATVSQEWKLASGMILYEFCDIVNVIIDKNPAIGFLVVFLDFLQSEISCFPVFLYAAIVLVACVVAIDIAVVVVVVVVVAAAAAAVAFIGIVGDGAINVRVIRGGRLLLALLNGRIRFIFRRRYLLALLLAIGRRSGRTGRGQNGNGIRTRAASGAQVVVVVPLLLLLLFDLRIVVAFIEIGQSRCRRLMVRRWCCTRCCRCWRWCCALAFIMNIWFCC